MKLQVFKESITNRLMLLKASTIYSFQKETAYFANNWASLLSTSSYTLMMLLFINVLFSNVRTVAGYTRDEMLLFFLVGQIGYYITASISFDPMRELIYSVNRGDLDLILTKPLPSLFYLTFKQVRFVSMLRDGLPPTAIIVFVINWGNLSFPMFNVFLGIPVFIAGLICLHVMYFLSVIPVFWFGESERILKMTFAIYSGAGGTIPLEGFVPSLRVLLSTAIPVLVMTGFTSSIILGKSNPYPLMLWSILIAVLAILLMTKVWGVALKHYTSASS